MDSVSTGLYSRSGSNACTITHSLSTWGISHIVRALKVRLLLILVAIYRESSE